MTTTIRHILTVLENDLQCTYDGFASHPDVPIESTSIFCAIEDNEFEWTQPWIILYWTEGDLTLFLQEEELVWSIGDKQKTVRETGESLVKKKLQVSGLYQSQGLLMVP